MISPEQLESQQINSMEQMVDMVRLNFNMMRQQVDALDEDKNKA